ncbi:MAG: hypothetical protein A2542_00245 [Parcubacteria group bacterium RIFOXYD2_FULL_52_8]|nr:MAG: hypothetical protein A2542_00245 [Parcubacteria group bacterium RIFOXYD2_FULL_52_8]
MFRQETVLAGTLEDLDRHLMVQEDLRDIKKAFQGEAVIKPPHRIPAADNGSDVFFGDRELLLRFSALMLPTQKCFLIALRGALDANKTEILQIRIEWTTTKSRELLVTRTNDNLDFDLL